MKEPVRVISDLHMGHKVSRVEKVSNLRPLIAGAGTIIFNGDTWQELAPPFRERSAVMLEELKQLCAAESCEAHFLSGNHDPGCPGAGWIELAEGRIVVTHGDAILDDCSPWKREILTGGEIVRAIWRKYPGAHFDFDERIRVTREIARALPTEQHSQGRSLLQRAWDAVTPPERALKMMESWHSQGAAALLFCERYFPQAEILVIGHFHRHGTWRDNLRCVINTGCFVNPSKALWVEWNNNWLTCGHVDESCGDFRKGEVTDSWRFSN